MGSTFILDPNVFTQSYIPPWLVVRDQELNFLLQSLSQLQELSTHGLMVLGLPGSGKSLVFNYLLARLDGSCPKPIYIECKYFNTVYRLILELASRLGIQVPPSGWSTDRILDGISNLAPTKPEYVLILDGMESLRLRESWILHDLVKLWVLDQGQILLASLDPRALSNLDPRLRKIICNHPLMLKCYTSHQLFRILDQRAALGLKPRSFSPEALDVCSNHVAENELGNARIGLSLLEKAARIAERSGAAKLLPDHIADAISLYHWMHYSSILQNLGLHIKLALMSLVLDPSPNPITTGELFSKYKKLCHLSGINPCTLRNLNRGLCYLETLGILERKLVNRGRRAGRTHLIRSNLPLDQLKQLLIRDPELEQILPGILEAHQTYLAEFW